MTGETLPAVLYCAKSTEDKHGSLVTQLQDCRAMAAREGWEIVGEFRDEGFSAYHGNRGPGLAAARERVAEAAQTASEAVLVVQHSDRLARGAGDAPGAAEHLAEVLFWARRHNVRLRSVQDDDSLRNPLLAMVMGERNFEDSRRKSAAVKAGMQRRVQRGQYSGGPAPYGYRAEGPKGERRLVIHEPEAVIVRRIFDEFVAGRSQKAIARDLDIDGVVTRRGGTWCQGTVGKIISNGHHMGCVRINGQHYDGQHEAIISPEMWERARALREASARTPSKGRGRRPKARHLFINGHLRCGRCGEAMIPRSHDMEAGRPDYAVYACYRRIRLGPDACAQEPIKREAIDRAVRDYFASSVLDLEATRHEFERAAEGKLAEVRELLADADAQERKTRDALARIRRDYREDKISADDWHEFRDEMTAELDAATAKVARLTEQEARVVADASLDGESDTFRSLQQIREAVIGTVQEAHGPEAIRAALLRLFDSFTLRRHAEPFDRDVYYGSLMGVGGGYELEPHVREDAIAGYGPSGVTARPMRTALTGAENKDANGLQT